MNAEEFYEALEIAYNSSDIVMAINKENGELQNVVSIHREYHEDSRSYTIWIETEDH